MDLEDFIEDGPGGIILVVIAIFIIVRLVRKARRGGFIPLIKVTDYKIGEESSPGSLLEIQGNRTGFGAWLLDLLGLRSRHVKILFHKDYMEQVDGRKKFNRIPSRDGYSSKVGYSTNKLLMILSVIFSLMAIFCFLMLLSGQGDIEILWFPILLMALLAFISFYQYKRSTVIHVSVQTNRKNTIGVNIKPSIDKTITKEDMKKIKDALHLGINNSSRFYNNHYK